MQTVDKKIGFNPLHWGLFSLSDFISKFEDKVSNDELKKIHSECVVRCSQVSPVETVKKRGRKKKNSV